MAEAFIHARPRFQVAGEDQPAMAEAVKDVSIHQPLSGRAHAEIRLINWGRSGPDFLFQDLKHGDSVDIRIGENDQPALFSGDVTAIEERYGDGAPQLLLLLEDKLHKLARQRHSRSFEAQTLDDVLTTLAREASLNADIRVSAQTADWHQFNESNLAFMQRLLAPYDIAMRLQDNQLRIRAEEADSRPVRLSPQDGIEYLRIIADLNGQPASCRVSGWDLAQDDVADAQVDSLQPAPAGTEGSAVLRDLGWPGDGWLPQPFPRAQADADAWARAAFRQRAKAFLSGEAVCTGNPALRVGRELELYDVSERLRGRYQIVHCHHRFDSAKGFRSFLNLNRADWNPS